jgi:hypothetical protein
MHRNAKYAPTVISLLDELVKDTGLVGAMKGA